jgi:hypothetical protein
VSYTTLASLLAEQSASKPKFIHVAFTWSRVPKIKELEGPLFSKADDWMRYSANCWILYTLNDSSWWYEQIRHYITKTDRVFIVELKLQEKSGWLDKWAWNWLNKPR